MKKSKILMKGQIVWPDGTTEGRNVLEIDGGLITFIGENRTLLPGPEHRVFDFGSNYICPGFIDLHVHGTGGTDVMDGTYDALDWMSANLAEGGTTSFLATTMSAPRREVIEAVGNVSVTKLRGTSGAHIIGGHLEGPFLNPRRKGAHKEEDLRLPDVFELKEYLDAGNGTVRMITVAPELPGVLEVIEFAASRGLVVALGHSAATITQVDKACRAGLSHVTHTFNAMNGLHHRDPGTAGAALSMEQLTADVIPDGFHVHPRVIKILVRAKGINQVCVISDCIRAGGMEDGTFTCGGRKVTVKNGIARLDDGTISGSTLSMAQAVKTVVDKVGFTLAEAVKMASTNPARILGLNSKGVLTPGKDADIVVLDRNFKVLMTIVAGRIVYQCSG